MRHCTLHCCFNLLCYIFVILLCSFTLNIFNLKYPKYNIIRHFHVKIYSNARIIARYVFCFGCPYQFLLQDTVLGGMYRIDLAHDGDQWKVLVNTAMNLRVP
jgi:hypothetical protein